jgi:hypothetical protein
VGVKGGGLTGDSSSSSAAVGLRRLGRGVAGRDGTAKVGSSGWKMDATVGALVGGDVVALAFRFLVVGAPDAVVFFVGFVTLV